MNVNIFIGNHGKKSGIEDILEILTDVFTARGHQVEVADFLKKDSLNIIIDEFTNYFSNNYIRNFRMNNPCTHVTLVLTEFPRTNFLVTSFNNFNGVNEAAKIALITCYIKLIRPEYGLITVSDFMLGVFYSPLVFIGFVVNWIFGGLSKKSISDYFNRNSRLVYLKMRFLGFKQMLSMVDAVALLHPNVLDGIVLADNVKNLGVIYPELNINKIRKSILKNKRSGFEITGSITRHRQKWVNKINRLLLVYGLHHQCSLTQTVNFDMSDHQKSPAAFSLHPPQTRRWAYCSPTRIFRSIQHDLNIPVVTRYFGQHPIENVAINFNGVNTVDYLLELIKDRNALNTYIKLQVLPYVDIAKSNNDSLVEMFEEICSKVNLNER